MIIVTNNWSTPETWGLSQHASEGMYLDPIYTLFKLASLNFHVPETTLQISANQILFAKPEEQKPCASLEELRNLVPTLYYAVKRLHPNSNPSARLICLLAWRGLAVLADGYRKAGNMPIVMLIQGTLMRMLEDTFKGQPPEPRHYVPVSLNEHDLFKISDRYWMSQTSHHFFDIHTDLMGALIAMMIGKEINARKYVMLMDRKLAEIANKIHTFATATAQSSTGPSRPEEMFYPVDTQTLKYAGVTPENNLLIRERFWPWFKQDFANPPNWNAAGIPFQEHRTDKTANLWPWLGLDSTGTTPPHAMKSTSFEDDLSSSFCIGSPMKEMSRSYGLPSIISTRTPIDKAIVKERYHEGESISSSSSSPLTSVSLPTTPLEPGTSLLSTMFGRR